MVFELVLTEVNPSIEPNYITFVKQKRQCLARSDTTPTHNIVQKKLTTHFTHKSAQHTSITGKPVYVPSDRVQAL